MTVTLHDPDRPGVVQTVLPLSTNDARMLLVALHKVLGPIALPAEADDEVEDRPLEEVLIDALADFVTDIVEGILDDGPDPEPEFLELPSDTVMRVGWRPGEPV
jgi:hypothetical protein